MLLFSRHSEIILTSFSVCSILTLKHRRLVWERVTRFWETTLCRNMVKRKVSLNSKLNVSNVVSRHGLFGVNISHSAQTVLDILDALNFATSLLGGFGRGSTSKSCASACRASGCRGGIRRQCSRCHMLYF